MRRLILTSIIGLLLATSQVFASEVTNVELSNQNGLTVARIDVDGPIRFMHQTEVAKDGKPYRVIVDVLSATHELGAKVFEDLPACPVLGIRTSQYSVRPEKIVRIVFDMKEELVYKIDSDGQAVVVTFSHPPIPSFASWSTAETIGEAKSSVQPTPGNGPVDEPKVEKAKPSPTVAQANAAIEKDRLSSLSQSDQKASSEAKKEMKPVQKQMASAKTQTSPGTNVPLPSVEKPMSNSEQSKVAVEKPVAKPEVKKAEVASKPETKEQPKAVAKSSSAAPTKAAVAQAKTEKTASENSQKALAKKITKEADKPTVAKKQDAEKPIADKNQSTKAKSPEKTKSPVKKSSSKTVAKNDSKNEESAGSRKSTARFRRATESSAKIKGTMVAEFPKRLTIKYKASGYADPFRVLIDKTTQSSDQPIEQRLANIEGLKLVGVIESSEGANRALFEDNEGYGYMLKAGDKVKNGYVLRVDREQVHFQIFEYGWSRTVALKME